MSIDPKRPEDGNFRMWLKSVYRQSLLAEVVGAFSDNLVVSSVISGYFSVLKLAHRSSSYRFLRRITEPGIVSIDLRETRTLGPILSLIDWVSHHTTPILHNSWTYRTVTAFTNWISQSLRTESDQQ